MQELEIHTLQIQKNLNLLNPIHHGHLVNLIINGKHQLQNQMIIKGISGTNLLIKVIIQKVGRSCRIAEHPFVTSKGVPVKARYL